MLTKRQLLVFQRFVQGETHKEIAENIGISPSLSSKELTAARDHLVNSLEEPKTGLDLEAEYNLPLELIADEVCREAKKRSERCYDDGRYDEGLYWIRLAEGFYGISPPSTTRYQRRKSE